MNEQERKGDDRFDQGIDSHVKPGDHPRDSMLVPQCEAGVDQQKNGNPDQHRRSLT